MVAEHGTLNQLVCSLAPQGESRGSLTLRAEEQSQRASQLLSVSVGKPEPLWHNNPRGSRNDLSNTDLYPTCER